MTDQIQKDKWLVRHMQTELLTGVVAHPCTPEWANYGKTVFNDPFVRLYLIRDGEGWVWHHNRRFDLAPGALFVIPAYTPGRYCCPERMSLTWLHFTVTFFGTIDPFARLRWPFAIPADAEASGQLEQLIHDLGKQDLASHVRAQGLLRLLLARFSAAAPAEPQTLAQEHLARLHPVLMHIEQHLERRMRLAELAGLMHLQPTYFSNLFSAQIGLPPMQFINQQRVHRAAGLLAATDEPINIIAGQVGFDDVYYFSKQFKRHLGMPPTHYRAQLRTEA